MLIHNQRGSERLRLVPGPASIGEDAAAESRKRKWIIGLALGTIVIAAGVAAATYNVFTSVKPKTGSEQIASLPPINGCVFSKATVQVRAKAGDGLQALIIRGTKGIDFDSACLDEAEQLAEQWNGLGDYPIPIIGHTYDVPKKFLYDLDSR